MTILEPCPLCSKEAVLIKHSSAYSDEFSVRCYEGCCESASEEHEQDAVAAWNTRPEASALIRELVEALEAARIELTARGCRNNGTMDLVEGALSKVKPLSSPLGSDTDG